MMSERVIGGTASAAEASGINGGGGGKKDAIQYTRITSGPFPLKRMTLQRL